MGKLTPGASMVLGLLIVSSACRGQAWREKSNK